MWKENKGLLLICIVIFSLGIFSLTQYFLVALDLFYRG